MYFPEINSEVLKIECRYPVIVCNLANKITMSPANFKADIKQFNYHCKSLAELLTYFMRIKNQGKFINLQREALDLTRQGREKLSPCSVPSSAR